MSLTLKQEKMKINQSIWQYCAYVSQSSHASIKAVEAVAKIQTDKQQNTSHCIGIPHNQEVHVIREMARLYRKNSNLTPRELAKQVLAHVFKGIWEKENWAGYQEALISHFEDLWNKLAADGVVFKDVINF